MEIHAEHPPIGKVLQNYLYLLQWDSSTKILSLVIDNQATEKITELLAGGSLVEHHKKELFPEHTSYAPTFDSNFGFNDCGRIIKEFDDRFLKIDFTIEPLYLLGDTCEVCGGTGQKDDRSCFYCNGGGKKRIENKQPAFAITNTLALLFAVLDYYPSLVFEKDSANKMTQQWPDQLYMIRSHCRRDVYGHAVGGVQSPRFTQALRNYYEEKVKQGTDISGRVICEPALKDMLAAHYFLTNTQAPSPFFGNITARVREFGGLYVETEGQNGCTLSTVETGMKEYWYEDDDSKSLNCHNLDSALQQLVLLIGLARVSECTFLYL